MADLIAEDLLAGRLPQTVGGVTLSTLDLGQVTSIAPYQDADPAVTALLRDAFGLTFPAPGEALGQDEVPGAVRLIWAGARQALLCGAAPPAGLDRHAALVDQTDGHAMVRLTGGGAEAVLARLVPLDLREAAFATDRTARTHLGQMAASVTRAGADGFDIAVPRSMADTLLHDLLRAMAQVASRG